ESTPDLPLVILRKLSDALGLPPRTLLLGESPASTETSADGKKSNAAKLGAAMVLIGDRRRPPMLIAEALDWSRRQIIHIGGELAAGLRHCGLRLSRADSGWSIEPGQGVLDEHEIERLLRAEHSADELNLSQVRMLKRVIRGQITREALNR